jgi:hypothetical protein
MDMMIISGRSPLLPLSENFQSSRIGRNRESRPLSPFYRDEVIDAVLLALQISRSIRAADSFGAMGLMRTQH